MTQYLDDKLFIVALYISFFIFSIIFSSILNIILLKFAQTLGIRNENNIESRWSNSAKPALGGITFFIIFLVSLIFARFFFEAVFFSNIKLLGIFFSLIVAFLLGLFDDAYNTHPYIKFFSQLFCALLLVLTGTHISLFNNDILNYTLTIFWVIGIMNSINMLDNMDAITTIVSIVIIILTIALFFFNNYYFSTDLLIYICLLGSLISFLFFNWHPSKMFMGDTGTQFLGLFLAIIGISFFWNSELNTQNLSISKQITQVLLVFALPIIDTSTVFIKRIANKKSPFIGGKDHTTHHLSYLGLSDRQVALVFSGIALISAFLGYSLLFIKTFTTLHAVLYVLYFVIIFATLFTIAVKTKSEP